MSAPTAGIPATFTQESIVYGDDGMAVDFPSGEDDSWDDVPGTETVFTALSNQIASVDPFVKEIASLYEGNSTQAEIDECKTFLGALMEQGKTFLNNKIVAKKAELMKPNGGGTKRKTSVVVCSVQQEAQNPRDSSHAVCLILYNCIYYNQFSRQDRRDS